MNPPSIARWFMAPFATTVEVFLRKNFGAQYWSFSSFLGGIIIIGLFRIIYGVGELGQSLMSSFTGSHDSNHVNWIYGVWLCFILMGMYHFILQSYHEAVGKKILSTSMGESRLFGVGKVLLALINRVVNRIVTLLLPYLPEKDRRKLEISPIKFSDYETFTFRVVEPLSVFLLAQVFSMISGLVSFWLLVSSIMLALHSSLNLTKSKEWVWQERDAQIREEERLAHHQTSMDESNIHLNNQRRPVAAAHSIQS